jgi:hypothetical protein
MDETVINGANLFFARQFGIESQDYPEGSAERGRAEWLLGLVNSAPYVSLSMKSPLPSAPPAHRSLALLCRPRLLAHRPRESLLPLILHITEPSPPFSLTNDLVVGGPSSSQLPFHSSPVSGKVSPTHGHIYSSLASFSVSASVQRVRLFPSTLPNALRPPSVVPSL